jgi:hypothetical protein
MNKSEIIIASIAHVLNLVDEPLDPNLLVPVMQSDASPSMSYRNLEFLAVSLHHQLDYLEKKFGMTFYTLNLQYLFEVKRDNVTKAFVYGDLNRNESLEDTLCIFKRDTGIATRYIPMNNDLQWKEHTDPTLILYAGLPIRFHHKTIYYSVASIIERLFGRDLTLIAGTKLDGFLKRAKNTNIPQRILAM